jgi:hypothetical protein
MLRLANGLATTVVAARMAATIVALSFMFQRKEAKDRKGKKEKKKK